MSVFRTRVFAVLAKIEGTEGTDSLPVLGTDALRLINQPKLALSYIETGRKNDQQHAGLGRLARNAPQGKVAQLDVTVELRGKGSQYTAITDPIEADVLFQMAGFSKTYFSNKILYTTLDTGMLTGTVYVYAANGKLFKLVGCIAKGPKISMTPGNPATATFTIIGRYSSVTDSYSLTGLTLPNVIAPIWANNVFLASWSNGAADPLVARKASVDVNTVEGVRPWASAGTVKGHYISDRTVKCAMDVEPVALSVFDPYANSAVDGLTSMQLQTSLGSATGNTVAITTGNIGLEFPTHIDMQGLAGWTLQGEVAARSIPSGDGAGRELVIAYT